MTTFIDTCVLISSLKGDDKKEVHTDWSRAKLEEIKAQGPIIIVDMVYAELSVAMDSKEHVDETVATLGLERFPNNDQVLFRAGKALMDYRNQRRKNSGENINNARVMADFIIGAAAEVSNYPLVTTNGGDFKTYFPKITLIHP